MFGRVARCIDPITGEAGVEPETLAGPAEGIISKVGYDENVNYNVVIENGGVGTGYVGLSNCRPITYNPACVMEIDGEEETVGVLTVDCIKGRIEGQDCTEWIRTDWVDSNKNYNVPLWSGCYGDEYCKFQGMAVSNAYPLYFNPAVGRLNTCEFKAGTNTSLTDRTLTSTCFKFCVDSFDLCTAKVDFETGDVKLHTTSNATCIYIPGACYLNDGKWYLNGVGTGPGRNQYYCTSEGRWYDGYGEAWVEACQLGSQYGQNIYAYTRAGEMCYTNGSVTSLVRVGIDNNSCSLITNCAQHIYTCTNAIDLDIANTVNASCTQIQIGCDGFTSRCTSTNVCRKFCFTDFQRYCWNGSEWVKEEFAGSITCMGVCNNFDQIIANATTGVISMGYTNGYSNQFSWWSNRCQQTCCNTFCQTAVWTIMKYDSNYYDFKVVGQLQGCGSKRFEFHRTRHGGYECCMLFPEPGTVLATWYQSPQCLDVGEVL